jgi:predicted DNA binding CopG/RHH family protein
LTLDLPEALHRTIKMRAVTEGLSIVEMLRELLEREYGAPH